MSLITIVRMMMTYLTKRGGFWYFARRVPKRYGLLDRRGIVYTSTGIRIVDDLRGIRAKRIAADLNAAVEDYWQALSDGDIRKAARKYAIALKAAAETAISLSSSRRRPNEEILAEVKRRLDILELLAKVEALEKRYGVKR